jgi:hypothetical protein
MRHKAPDSRLNAGACARRKSVALPEVLWAGRKRASVSRQRRHRQHVVVCEEHGSSDDLLIS